VEEWRAAGAARPSCVWRAHSELATSFSPAAWNSGTAPAACLFLTRIGEWRMPGVHSDPCRGAFISYGYRVLLRRTGACGNAHTVLCYLLYACLYNDGRGCKLLAYSADKGKGSGVGISVDMPRTASSRVTSRGRWRVSISISINTCTAFGAFTVRKP